VLRRLLIGLAKGLVVGGALGAGLQIGLGWGETSGLLGYLLAMGAGATAGILAGKPPWRAEAWIESVLKGVFGLGTGALVYFLGSSYGSFEVPFALPGAASGTPWTSQPLLYATAIGGVFGSLVELDNTDDGDKSESESGGGSGKAKRSTRVRIGGLDDDEVMDIVSGGSGKKSKRA
jgi:hypothetical protein